MKKGLLIIGGGILQERTIFWCKKLNINIYLVDGNNKCYCKTKVKNFYNIDCFDIKRILQIAKKLKKNNKIHGVYTQGADFAPTVSYISKKLNFCSVDFNSAKICKNKFLLRQELTKHNLSDVRYFKIKTLNDLKNKISKIKLPVYLKPLDNSASRGVIKINKISEYKSAYNFAIKSCIKEKSLILEEEIKGNELSVDTIIYNKNFYPCGISERKFLKKNKYAVQYASITPANLSIKKINETYSLMQKAAKALKIDNSAFKGDLVIDSKDGKIKIIELTPRLSGGFDSQYRKPISYKLDLIKYTILISLKIKFDPKNLDLKLKKFSSTFSVLFKPGYFKNFYNLKSLKQIKGIKKYFLLSKKGDKIEELNNCSQRNNFFICFSKSKKMLYKIHKKINSTLKVKYL
tara:strand:+ start:188 stop:1402 length:1215 start_codon:yes stop_codon:yes gene_type:complete